MEVLFKTAVYWALGLFLIVRIYIVGVWFLVTSPRVFYKFMLHYLDFHYQIEEADQIRESGFWNFNRRARRKMEREVRRREGKQ